MPAATIALALLAATAAAPGGQTTIALDGAVAASLREQGVAVVRQLALPVRGGDLLADGAALALRGTLTLKVRRDGRTRALDFRRWRVRMRAGRTTLTAVVGGRRRVVLGADVPPWRLSLSASKGTVRLRPVTARLTTAAARLIRRRLSLDALKPGAMGRMTARATLAVEDGSGGPGDGGRRGPTGPTCTPGFESGEVTPAGPPLTRPAGAVDVASATLVWWPRDTFLRYIAVDEGATGSDGAEPFPPETLPGTSVALVYRWGLELRAGSWYDGASDTAGLLARGTVRFQMSSHDIDITMKDPEIEIDGAASQVVFTIAGGDCTDREELRAGMLTFTPGTPSEAGDTYDFGNVVTYANANTASAFGGFYAPGLDWGAFDVAFTLAP